MNRPTLATRCCHQCPCTACSREKVGETSLLYSQKIWQGIKFGGLPFKSLAYHNINDKEDIHTNNHNGNHPYNNAPDTVRKIYMHIYPTLGKFSNLHRVFELPHHISIGRSMQQW